MLPFCFIAQPLVDLICFISGINVMAEVDVPGHAESW